MGSDEDDKHLWRTQENLLVFCLTEEEDRV